MPYRQTLTGQCWHKLEGSQEKNSRRKIADYSAMRFAKH